MYFFPLSKLKISLLVFVITIFLAPAVSLAATSTLVSPLVINEFQISGETSTQLHEEYIVIKNVSAESFDVKDCIISKSATSAKLYPLYVFGARVLDPNETVKLAHLDYTNEADYRFVVGSSNTLSTSNSIILDCGTRASDTVGYGDGYYYEGTRLSNPGYGQVYVRDGDDSNNNFVDFILYVEPIMIDLNAGKLVISELLPNPAAGSEWFELYNPTNLDISLVNLKICDALGSRHCYYFDAGDVLLANSYRIYEQVVTKITLNNTGDWLELYDVADNLLADSGGNFGAADKGVSLSVFGNEYRWTASLTPGAANIFTDTIELEADSVVPTAKVSKSKVVKAAKRTVVAKASGVAVESGDVVQPETAVKAAKSTSLAAALQTAIVSKKTLGWALIGLAILLVLGYTLWYFRDYAKEIYHKIRPGDDSARF